MAEPMNIEDARLEDELAEVIEPLLVKYKDRILYPQYSKVDFLNFAAHDIARVAIPLIEKRAREKVLGEIEKEMAWYWQTCDDRIEAIRKWQALKERGS